MDALITKPIAYIFEIFYSVRMCAFVDESHLQLEEIEWRKKSDRQTSYPERFSILISVSSLASIVRSRGRCLCATLENHLGRKSTTFASMHTRK